MKAFAYVNPANEKEAAAALRDAGVAMPIGGGQDILARMKDYITSPDRIVNIKSALDTTITPVAGGLKIGAAVKIVDLAENAQVKALYPNISAAAIEVGTPQIRHQGTVGGNVNQRPRCWYFKNEEFLCYKKGGNRCFAPAGENQYHAIFGNDGPSHIVHPSSLAVPFVAYGAKFRVVNASGEREIAAADFFTLPTLQNVRKENVLADDELLTHVILPAPGVARHGHYEVRYKESHDWPISFATVILKMSGTTISSARVVLGAVAPIPWRSEEAERALVGKTLSEATAVAAGEAAVRGAAPMSRNGYKVQVTKTAVKRAVMRAAGLRNRLAYGTPSMSEDLRSTRITFGVHCLKIRHKGMYVSYEPDPDPEVYNELFNSGSYWCAQTQTSFGPDGQPVRPDICQGERICCDL